MFNDVPLLLVIMMMVSPWISRHETMFMRLVAQGVFGDRMGFLAI